MYLVQLIAHVACSGKTFKVKKACGTPWSFYQGKKLQLFTELNSEAERCVLGTQLAGDSTIRGELASVFFRAFVGGGPESGQC